MNSPRWLLILFAFAFLAVQVVGFLGGISRHQENVAKLEKQVVKYETEGAYIDLKSDPAVKLKEEKARFKTETIGFVVKILVISGVTAFVYALIKNERRPRDG